MRHSEETRRLIGSKNSVHQAGNKNSQFGTKWIHHEDYGSKKILGKYIVEYLNQGWWVGKLPNEKKPSKVSKNNGLVTVQINKIFYFERLHAIYEKLGYSEFCKLTGYSKSAPNLVQQFKKYVKDFLPQNGKIRYIPS